MRTNAQVRIESMLDELHAVTARTTQLKAAIEALAVTVRSDDGSVTVTVDARGGLTDLRIEAEASQRLDSVALAEVILNTAGTAAEDIHRRTQALVATCLPPPFLELFNPAVDAFRLPTVDSLGDRRSRGW